MMSFLLLVFLIVALGAGGLAARSYMTGEPVLGNFFGPPPIKRLSVIEQTSVDNRRKLVLLRRDGIEHLVMTGGPVDVVIETGIGAPTASAVAIRAPSKPETEPTPATATSTVFGRAARILGQAVNE